jgi:nitrite reductase (cytochrome c-552)
MAAPSATPSPPPPPSAPSSSGRRRIIIIGAVAAGMALATFAAAWLTVTIFQRKVEARNPYIIFVQVDDDTTDPAVWAANWPRQYDSYRRTVDHERTRYGGSDAIPKQKLDADPWLRVMWSGHAFSLDYREARGHAYMLADQDMTERVAQRSQPGACLHCHSSALRAYRHVGEGDVMEGFRKVNAMRWEEARNLRDEEGNLLVEHPANCVDCHDPNTMAIRITRPAFKIGIAELMRHEKGIENYDVNRDATRQQMRSFVCAQCHVEYYFTPGDTQVVYPWSRGIKVEEMEAYYDDIGFSDWTHGITGGGMIKAQHPEFELWSQGTHAAAGVSCADCHMPYRREGALKISDHHVRSPLLHIAASCQVCHNVPESELLARAHTIQDRTAALLKRAANALVDMIHAIGAARAAGVPDDELAEAIALQRSAQWRIDFVYSENSMGFHAPQETARILAEAVDYARQGQAIAQALFTTADPALPMRLPELDPITGEPILGVTPAEEAPPGPYRHPRMPETAPPRPR